MTLGNGRTHKSALALALALLCASALATPALAGNGGFTVTGIQFGGGSPAIDIGDFGNDGREDVAYSASAATGANLGDGLGGFGEQFIPTSGVQTHDLAVGDFNEDGLDDILNAAGFDNGIVEGVIVCLGLGGDRFSETEIDMQTPDSIAVGDFDNDNHDDFVVTSREEATNGITVATGDGDGGFTAGPLVTTSFSAGDVLSDVAVGDVNGDGDEDILVVNQTDGNVSVFTGAANAIFNAPTTVAVGTAPKAIAIADFEAESVFDNDLDFVTPVAGGQSSVRINNGSGSFSNGSSVATGTNAGGVTVGDFDSDDGVDLAFEVESGAFDTAVAIRLNNGVGGFFAAPVGSPYLLDHIDGEHDLAIGDFNGDGVQDLASHGGDVLLGTGEPLLSGNLLVNGGAEGANAAHGNGTAPRVPGWSDGLGGSVLTYVRYGSPGGFPRRAEGDRWEGGQSFFSGGPQDNNQEAFQDVDLTNRSQAIDAGGATATLQADLGGYKANNDRMAVEAKFLAEDGFTPTRAPVSIGPVTNGQRGNVTAFLRRRFSLISIPAGTRKIRVTIEAIYDAGVYINGYADNVGLFLANAPVNPAPPGPPAPVPSGGPTPGSAASVAQPAVKKCKKGRKLKRGRCIKKKKKRK